MTVVLSSANPIPQNDMSAIRSAISVQLEALNYGVKANSTTYKVAGGAKRNVSYVVTKTDGKEDKIYVSLKEF